MNRKRYMMVFVQAAEASELVIGTMSEPSIDPHFLYTSTNVAYSKHIFSRLVTVDENVRVIPELAKFWIAIDDNAWEFKLREDVKFHDGSDFTAADVAFSFERISKAGNGAFLPCARGIVGIRIADPFTIIIRTDKPNPLLPFQIVDISIVSKRASEKSETADFTSGKAAIGTGPYKFAEYAPGNHLVLQRNENYWGEKSAFGQVTFKILTNDDNRVAALLGGVADMIEFVPPSATELLEKKNFRIFKRASDRIIYLACNTLKDNSPYITDKNGKPLDKNPLKDIRVRKALSKAIYRDAIAQQVMKGLAFPASQLIPEGWYSYNPDLKVEKYDPDGAKKLLAEAGYPDAFALTIHGPDDRYVNDAKVCGAIAQMLTKIGVKTKVETMSKSLYFPKVFPPQNEFAFSLLGWGSANDGDSSLVLATIAHSYDKAKGMGLNNPGHANPKTDILIGNATAMSDTVAREKMLQEAMAAVINDYGIIPLHAQSVVVASKKGIVYTPRADEHTLAMNARPE